MYYHLLEGYTVTEDGDGAKTYGVAVFDRNCTTIPEEENQCDKRFCIYANADITFSPQEMRKHIKLWNEMQPSLSQLKELIEDIICAEATTLKPT